MDQRDSPGRAALPAGLQADQREKVVATVAALLANAIPDAFATIGDRSSNDIPFDLERDFSALERLRFREVADAVVRSLERGERDAAKWNWLGPAGIAAQEAAMSNKASGVDDAENPSPTGDRPRAAPPMDVDPLEGGGIVPGAPPGETFGSVATTPPSEAELNERAGRRPKP